MALSPTPAPPALSAPRSDAAAWWILGSNALAIVGAALDHGGLVMLMWIYWGQSVVIGWFARRRMLLLDKFSTAGLLINDQPVAPTRETQRRTANFFALHYGAFHFAYMTFLATSSAPGSGRIGSLDFLLIALVVVSFFASHRESHRENVAADLARVPNLGSLMFLPYARIVPMHLTIIFAAKSDVGGGLLVFGALKTAADLLMHKVEHRWLQRPTR